MKNGCYSIGEISKLCCVSISRLRYYDEIGVIKPCFVDEESGYRYYDSEALLLLSVLKYYQQCRFKLREIKALLKRSTVRDLAPLFTQHIASLNAQIQDLTSKRDVLASWNDLLTEQQRVVSSGENPIVLRRYGAAAMYYSKPYIWNGMDYRDLVANIQMCNCIAAESPGGATGPLYIYFPNTKAHHLAETSIYIRPYCPETPFTDMVTTDAFDALCTYHIGSFSQIQTTYERIYRYADANKIVLRGDSFERSVVDWWSTTQEEEFLMEILLPATSGEAFHNAPNCSM